MLPRCREGFAMLRSILGGIIFGLAFPISVFAASIEAEENDFDGEKVTFI